MSELILVLVVIVVKQSTWAVHIVLIDKLGLVHLHSWVTVLKATHLVSEVAISRVVNHIHLLHLKLQHSLLLLHLHHHLLLLHWVHPGSHSAHHLRTIAHCSRVVHARLSHECVGVNLRLEARVLLLLGLNTWVVPHGSSVTAGCVQQSWWSKIVLGLALDLGHQTRCRDVKQIGSVVPHCSLLQRVLLVHASHLLHLLRLRILCLAHTHASEKVVLLLGYLWSSDAHAAKNGRSVLLLRHSHGLLGCLVHETKACWLALGGLLHTCGLSLINETKRVTNWLGLLLRGLSNIQSRKHAVHLLARLLLLVDETECIWSLSLRLTCSSKQVHQTSSICSIVWLGLNLRLSSLRLVCLERPRTLWCTS